MPIPASHPLQIIYQPSYRPSPPLLALQQTSLIFEVYCNVLRGSWKSPISPQRYVCNAQAILLDVRLAELHSSYRFIH